MGSPIAGRSACFAGLGLTSAAGLLSVLPLGRGDDGVSSCGSIVSPSSASPAWMISEPCGVVHVTALWAALGMFGVASGLMIVGWLTMTGRSALGVGSVIAAVTLGLSAIVTLFVVRRAVFWPEPVLRPAWRTAALIALGATLALGAATAVAALETRRSAAGIDGAPHDDTARAGKVSLGCGLVVWLSAGLLSTTSWLTTTGDGLRACGSIVSPDQYGAWDDQSTCGIVHLATLAIVAVMVYAGGVAMLAAWLTLTGRPALRLGAVIVGAVTAIALAGAVVRVWRAVTWLHPPDTDFAVAWDHIAVLTAAGAVVLAVVTLLMALEASGRLPGARASRAANVPGTVNAGPTTHASRSRRRSSPTTATRR